MRVAIAFAIFAMLVACSQPVVPSITQTPIPSQSFGTPSQVSPTVSSLALPATQSPILTTTIGSSFSQSLFSFPEVITRGEIQDIAASPDGRWLAVASAGGLYLHDAYTLAIVRNMLEHLWVNGMAFSPDSRTMAVFGKGWLRLIDLNSARTINQLDATILKLEFTPDGKSLVALQDWSRPAVLQIWDLPGWEERQISYDVEEPARSMALSPDGATLALGGESGWLELFEFQSARRLAVLSESAGLPLTDLAFSPDGSLLAAADQSTDGRLRVWRVAGRKKLVEQYASGFYSIQPFVTFSADGKRLLGGMGDLAIAWERNGVRQVGVLSGYASGLMDLEISPEEERLAYTTRNWPVYIWDLDGQNPPLEYSVPFYQSFNIAFSPDGRKVAAGLYSYAPVPQPDHPAEMVSFLDVKSGEEVDSLPDASAAAYSPDGRFLAIADTRGNLRVLDLDRDVVICLPGCTCSPTGGDGKDTGCSLKLPHELSPMEMSYSPDGRLLAVWGVAGSWSASGLIDMSTGEELAWFEGGSRISFGRNSLIALGVDELNADHGLAANWLVLFDLVHAKELHRVELPAAGVAALSPDGKWLAVGLSTHEVTNPTGENLPDPVENGLMIWDVDAWQQVAYHPIPYGVTRLAFSPRGDYLITASETGEILRWARSP